VNNSEIYNRDIYILLKALITPRKKQDCRGIV